jgi:hypothetical protein
MVSPDDWVAKQPGMGSCFHRALHRWADQRTTGDIWKIAIGIVEGDEDGKPHRHLHAWLQRQRQVMSAVDGSLYFRETFYHRVGVDRRSVRLVNPRSIMRARDGVIDRDTVGALLDASGIKWTTVNGGVLPVE